MYFIIIIIYCVCLPLRSPLQWITGGVNLSLLFHLLITRCPMALETRGISRPVQISRAPFRLMNYNSSSNSVLKGPGLDFQFRSHLCPWLAACQIDGHWGTTLPLRPEWFWLCWPIAWLPPAPLELVVAWMLPEPADILWALKSNCGQDLPLHFCPSWWENLELDPNSPTALH